MKCSGRNCQEIFHKHQLSAVLITNKDGSKKGLCPKCIQKRKLKYNRTDYPSRKKKQAPKKESLKGLVEKMLEEYDDSMFIV